MKEFKWKRINAKGAAAIALTCYLSIVLLSGCGKSDVQHKAEMPESIAAGIAVAEGGGENAEKAESITAGIAAEEGGGENAEMPEGITIGTVAEENGGRKHVVQGGPYGEISIVFPARWSYETYPVDSEELCSGMYGIHFFPEDAQEGYVELVYMDFFGVCGTGLETTSSFIAGSPANIGVYDGHAYWDFISFQGKNEGIIALAQEVDSWWEQYEVQVLDILNTLSFDRNRKEGGAYIYSAESEVEKIGLWFQLRNISATGAEMVFRQYDKKAPTGELQYGEDFALEKEVDGSWVEVPVALEGDYGFHEPAYLITLDDTTKKEIKWEWLYGALAPGNYRLRKEVMDFRGSGDFDKYILYAQFLLN